MATTNHTGSYGLSQYAATDPVNFLTNYNGDMAAIDAAIKAAKDSADAKIPLTRTVAGLPLTADLTLAQLTAAGLASGDSSGNAQNALELGGNPAANFPQITTGTWTPTLFGTTTAGMAAITGASCKYVKIGSLVVVTAYFDATLSGAAGKLALGGLPFAVGATAVLVTRATAAPIGTATSGSSQFILSTINAGVYSDLDASAISSFAFHGSVGIYTV